MAGLHKGGWRAWLGLRGRPRHDGQLGDDPGSEVAAAKSLIAAIDAGGLPLNPARVNAIARALGLDVSVHAPVEQTIDRIRAALSRLGPGA